MIFISQTEEIVRGGAFPPVGDPSLGLFWLSIISHAILHADISHLAGNMFFLWAFGSAVESRVGSLKYLGVYFLSIFIATLFGVIIGNIQASNLDPNLHLVNHHSIGASGAVSGIMGLFVVRCFYSRLTISCPIFFLPFPSVPLRVQGTLLVALFFMMDVSGSVSQYEMEGGDINHWAHVGGYLCGLALGLLMRLHKAAAEEAVHDKAGRLAESLDNSMEAIKVYGEILEQEPENERALLYYFNKYKMIQSDNTAKYFCRLVDLYAKKDIRKAIELVDEGFPKHINFLRGDTLLKIGLYYTRIMDWRKASFCLNLSKEMKWPWQAKAMLKLSEVYTAMEVPERAKALLQELMEKYPSTVFQRKAELSLSELG